MSVSKIHELKCLQQFFEAILGGHKTFEVRFNDRGYGVGDSLRLKEYRLGTQGYTGRSLTCRVTYILAGPSFGVDSGFVVMAIADVCETEARS